MSEPDVSTRPYLIRAIYEWCTDQGYTPYLAVLADATARVPAQYVQDGQIVLNVSASATSGLKMGNEWIEFSARFGGVPHEIMVPVDRVLAIYARENGQGMAFGGPHDVPRDTDDEELEQDDTSPAIKLVPSSADTASQDESPPDPPKGPPGRGKLKRVK